MKSISTPAIRYNEPSDVFSLVHGKVADIDTYGQALLDISKEDFQKAGFDLGDIVTVSCGSYTGSMPCFSGYYESSEQNEILSYFKEIH